MHKQRFISLSLVVILAGALFLRAEKSDAHPNELSIGFDHQSTYFSYKRTLSDSWRLRSGFFTNLEPDFMTYHFNLGTEFRISFTENAPELLLGLDLVSFNFHATERNLLGGGPVAGFRYEVTERFNITTEIGATGYMNESDDFRWSWHRKVALMAGWRF